MAALTDAEAAVYDRQVRVWGVETQKRLSAARVLIAGLPGVAAEVAKNLVLAGVGSVELADDTPLPGKAHGNFLATAAAVEAAAAAAGGEGARVPTVAEACAATLQEMNPLVKVAVRPGPAAAALAPAALEGVALLVLCGAPAADVAAADAACAAAGCALLAAGCRGAFGWAFASLGRHAFAVERGGGADGAPKEVVRRELVFPRWPAALEAGAAAAKAAAGGAAARRRHGSALLAPLLALAAVEAAEGRPAAAGDAPALLAALPGGEAAGAEARAAARALAGARGEWPAVAAVVGGVVANDAVRAVSRNGEPLIQNLFLFTAADSAGWVERLGMGEHEAAAPAECVDLSDSE